MYFALSDVCAESKSPSAILRSACARAHAATEQIPRLAALSAGRLNQSDYSLAIGGFAFLFTGLIDQILALPEGRRILALTEVDARAAAARSDAAILGVERAGCEACATPFARFVLDEPSALGVLYVLEGARMGGVLIRARLAATGHPLGEPGYTFFDVPPSGVAEAWRRFKAELDRRLCDAQAVCAAAAAACATFGLIQDVFGAL